MHNSILQQLSYIVPALSISFLIAITSINFYLKIRYILCFFLSRKCLNLLIFLFILNLFCRRKFPITVNCWFCNENTKVPYTQSNSWTCPSCEQYNGFTAVNKQINTKKIFFHFQLEGEISYRFYCLCGRMAIIIVIFQANAVQN